MPTTARWQWPIPPRVTSAGTSRRLVLMTSSIADRNSTASISTRRCWPLAVKSSADRSNSAACARTLHPAAPPERLHVDVKHRADGWPLVGCLLMVDAFDAENGATRFVPGTHLQPQEPSEVMNDPQDAHDEQILACGPAGSIIIFNASAWHGHGANRSARQRRSIQAHFVPRHAQAAPDDHCGRMRFETLQRISPLAKYVLNV